MITKSKIRYKLFKHGIIIGKLKIVKIDDTSYYSNLIITSIAQYDNLIISLSQDSTIRAYKFILD